MKHWFILLLLLFILALSLSGCATTQYVLTGQYTNPNTGDAEQIDIPVSQYEYDNIDVTDEYQLKIHTIILGIRYPITKHTNTTSFAFGDSLPIIIMAIPFYCLISTLVSKERKDKWEYTLIVLTFSMLSVALASTTAPDFDVIATIVDKTSGVY